MYFYKYQKPENLEFNMLRHGEIYFAQITELNDANECRPRFILNGTEQLWIRLAQYILAEVCFSSDYSDYYNRATEDEIRQLLELSISVGKQLKKQVKNRDIGIENLGKLFTDTLKPLLELNFSTLQSKLILDLSHEFIDRKLPSIIDEPKYITSFSKSATNPTMWGHYAKAEKGFVIVYSTEDGTINVRSPLNLLYGSRPLENEFGVISQIGCYDEAHVELQSVKYGKKPPKLNAFHRLIPKFYYSEMESHYDVPTLLEGDAKEKQEDQIDLVKYSDWRYEQEVRTFFPYTDEPCSADMRVLQVSINNIKGLIFGPSMTDGDKKRAILCCYIMRKSLAHLYVGKDKEQDWFEWAGVDFTPKQKLIEECQKYGVCIYEDDKMENELSLFRGVVSEVELQKRLDAKLAWIKSNKKDVIDLRLKEIGLFVSIMGLIVTILGSVAILHR